MADKMRTRAMNIAAFPNNTSGLISAQNGRDFIESVFPYQYAGPPTVDFDNANSAGVIDCDGFDNGNWLYDVLSGRLWWCADGTPHNALWWKIAFIEDVVPGVLQVHDGTNISITGTLQNPVVNVSGVLAGGMIPDLPASKITSGTLDLARIPDLPASKTTSGTFDLARIPDLPASKTTSGTFDLARIPGLPASVITSGTFPLWAIPSGYPYSSLAGAPAALAPEGPFAFMSAGATPSKFWYNAGFYTRPTGGQITFKSIAAGLVYAIPITFARGITIQEVVMRINGTIGQKKSMAIYAATATAVGNLYPDALELDLGEVTVSTNGVHTISFTTGLPKTLTPGKLFYLCFRQDTGATNGIVGTTSDFFAPLLGTEDQSGNPANTPAVCWAVSTTYASTWPSTFPAGGFTIAGEGANVPLLYFRC